MNNGVFPHSIVISYPRSGLHWLRWMLWHINQECYGATGLEVRNPLFRHNHDDQGLPRSKPFDASARRERHRGRKRRVVLLVRDPRDCCASNYQQIIVKRGLDMSFSAFLRHPVFGVSNISRWLAWWMTHGRETSKAFLLQTYEGMKREPETALKRIISFVGDPEVPRSVCAAAVAASTIEKMRAYEDQHQSLFPKGRAISGLRVGVESARLVGQGGSGSWRGWSDEDRDYAFAQILEILPEEDLYNMEGVYL